MRSPEKDPIIRGKIIVPTDEQAYMLWELSGLYTELCKLAFDMTNTPSQSLERCRQFTRNVKSVLGGDA